MFAAHNGNLILTTQGHSADSTSPTTVFSVNPIVGHNSNTVKATTAQFFSPTAAVASANAGNSSTNLGVLTSGVVSLFDAPAYVSADAPTTVNGSTPAEFLMGGYSVFEKNSRVYEATAGESDDEKSEDDEAEQEGGTAKKKQPKVNTHLMVPMVKGHRTAVLSPCHSFIYVLRTDTFALDWAVDITSIVSPAAATVTIQQIVLLDAHRVLLLLPKGKLYFATRPLSDANGTTYHDKADDNASTNARKPNADKFRYFVTSDIALVSIAGAQASIVSMLPLSMTHNAKAKEITVSLLTVAGANTSYSATTAELTIPVAGKNKPSLAVSADSAPSASFTTPGVPASFSIVLPTAVDDGSSAKKGAKKTSAKKSAAAGGNMVALISPIGVVIPTKAKDSAVGYIVALSASNSKVVSCAPVAMPAASSSSVTYVSVTTAELLNENMFAIGLVAGSSEDIPTVAAATVASSPLRKSGTLTASSSPKGGKKATASSAVVGKVVYGTFFFEKDDERSCGATVDASLINLTDADKALASESITLAPVGFYYNSRLEQHALVSVSVIKGSLAVKLCGVSLISGPPANGATIAASSWVSIQSALTSSLAEGMGTAEDVFTAAGKGASAADANNLKGFVTLNYPIVTVGAATTAGGAPLATMQDPYRIRDARVFGRASVTAPVSVHTKCLSQWPNAVIGVLKLLVDYTSYSMGVKAAASSPTTSSTSSVNSAVKGVFKAIADATKSVVGGAAAAGASFEVTIVTHAFHPSAIRNALRRLPFAVNAAAASLSGGATDKKKATGGAISTNNLVNGLFASLLDGVDATATALGKKPATTVVAADSFLRSAVGALDICHHIITLQGQLGASIDKQVISRYIVLLRGLRFLGGECDQIAGRLGATLDRQQMTAARALTLGDEKEKIEAYQQGGAANNDSQPKVSFAHVNITNKVASVGTGNVADGLSAQLQRNKPIMDLVEAKLNAKLAARAGTNANGSSATMPLYASAGMRSLKSDFQDRYEKYLLLGGSK